MYLVSDAFKTAMKKAQRVEHVRGKVGTEDFSDVNVLAMSYSNQCTDNKDVKFGSARIGQLKATFHGLNISRGSWRDKSIRLEYGLTLADDSVEYIPVGVFKIAAAEWTETGVTVTAYDCISELDGAFSYSTTAGRIYDVFKLGEELSGVPFGRTKTECEELPNGTEQVGLYPENDITTIRDYLSWAANTVGGFITADRNGHFIVRSFDESAIVDTFASRERIVGSVFSDYSTQYDGVNVTNIDGTVDYYSGEGSTGGLSIALGANPFLQYGTDLVRARQRRAIADVAVGIAYTPFNIALLNCPVYDLGDLIECEGGVAGENTLTCCVMAINWTFKQTITLLGYGADPNLTAGKSKADKALAGLASKTKENEVVIHTYTNAEDYDLDNHSREPVVGIDFATVKPCIVTMQHEINLDLDVIDDTATVTAYYYLNDELQSYQPIGTFSEDGKHIIPLMYFLNTLVGGQAYEWRVELQIDGGSGTIDRGDVHAWLQGQGLVALDEFAGTIHVEDVYEPIILTREIASIVDTVSELTIADYNVKVETLQDLWNVLGIGQKDLATLYDRNVSVQFAYVVYALVTDDGYAFVTDDGYTLTNSDGGYH